MLTITMRLLQSKRHNCTHRNTEPIHGFPVYTNIKALACTSGFTQVERQIRPQVIGYSNICGWVVNTLQPETVVL